MASFDWLWNLLLSIEVLRTIIILAVAFTLFRLIIQGVKKRLLRHAKTKKQISNIEIFAKIANYLFLLIVILSAIFSYSGSWASFGVTVGLMSAALGWALQKPITGTAAWLMVILKRPFEIGDRIIIGSVKGDVVDVTLTHIYVREVGGIVDGEESSGRITLIPNSTLFEQNITNYMFRNEYVLDQVFFIVKRESDLDEAISIAISAAKKHVGEFAKESKKEPYTRTFFQPDGISVHVRYFSPAQRLQEFSSAISKEIVQRVIRSKKVDFA